MARPGDIAPLLLDFAANPAVKHMLCAYITRTGVTCTGVRSHAKGEVVFDILYPAEKPDAVQRTGVYTLAFDPETGRLASATLVDSGD
jgi:hypothetical protein